MSQLHFTVDTEEILEAVMNSDMKSLFKTVIATILNAYMEHERTEYINAQKYERSAKRKDYRNGYYERSHTYTIGTIKLRVPRTRSGKFSPSVFKRYQRMDKAFVLSLVECVVNGVSTRRVTHIVEELCGESVSKSFVSSILDELDPQIKAFQNRSLTHSSFRYVYVDAMYIKVREDHRTVTKAVYIAQGVNDDNKREILGFMIGGEESTVNWTNFFRQLKARGLKEPKLLISDAHQGIQKAVETEMLGTSWQRCTVHFLRNIIGKMPKKDSKEARTMVKKIFRTNTQQKGRELKQAFEEAYSDKPKYFNAIKTLDQGFEDAIQFMLEPTAYQVSLRSTNSLERVNREIRRRDRVIGIYPNVESANRLLGAVLLDIHEVWKHANYKFLRDRGIP